MLVKEALTQKATLHMQENVENRGQKCYIPNSAICFIKCNIYFTDKEYTEEFQDFFKNEKYRSGGMTSARFQPFCRKFDIRIGCFDGKRSKS